jgi:predicted AlkP superfamily phosphohydrolase/phosphomutase
MTKVLVVGLDGANMDLIKRWSNEGKLPTFEKLMSDGCHGNLESVIPTITIPAWNCLASGKNPAKIGCFGFVQKVFGSYNFRFSSSIAKKYRNVWDILSDYGKSVFVLNAPNVQQAYKINNYMVAGGFCLSDEKLAYPASLRKDLDEMEFEMDIVDLYKLSVLDKDLTKKLKEITEKHFSALQHLLEKSCDFGFVVFSELDRVQHKFWNDEKLILHHYQNIDQKLKDLLDELDDETTVMLVSDHGFGHNKRIFFINEWLHKRKFLKVKKTRSLKLISMLSTILRKFYLFDVVMLLMKSPFLSILHQQAAQQTEKVDVVWGETKAFSYGTWGTIYINLSGREPDGIVKPEEYEQVRSEIIDGLKEISVNAYRREEIFCGEYLEQAPDIIIETDDYVNSISARVFYGKEFRKGFGGAHRRHNGIFIVRGPDIKENSKMNAKLLDIAPTILHIFGIPIPKDMDGRVLKEIFKGELAMREIKYQESNKNERIKRRVRDLKILGRI